MTTVVYDSRTREMVSDTQMGWHKVEADKIYRLSDGSLIGVAGILSDILLALDYLESEEDADVAKPDISPENHLMQVDPDGNLFVYTHVLRAVPVSAEYFAIGSGSEYAMGAMAQGATAEEAVAIAHKFDPNTGSNIVRVEL